jgi:hypothetical protein
MDNGFSEVTVALEKEINQFYDHLQDFPTKGMTGRFLMCWKRWLERKSYWLMDLLDAGLSNW